VHTDWWIGDADTLTLLKQLKNNGNKLQISKCLFRVLLSKKEKADRRTFIHDFLLSNLFEVNQLTSISLDIVSIVLVHF
jgi:hypothetical protein